MKFRILAVMFLIACDDSPGSYGDTSTDSGDTADPNFTAQGTQVGSEGIFGCEIDTVVPVTADSVPDGFTLSPPELLAPLIGTWNGDFVDFNAQTIALKLDIQPSNDFEWVTVLPTTGCADYLQVKTQATLTANPLFTESMAGVVAIRPDQSKAVFSVAADQVVGTASPLVIDLTTMDTAMLELVTDLTASDAAGELHFQGCTDGTCVDDDTQGTFTLARQ